MPKREDAPPPDPAADGPAPARRCLVLGGSGALGQAVCRALHGAGARVAFTYHRGVDRARALEDALPGARSLELDLRAAEAIEARVGEAGEHLGGLDALIHCAAVGVTADDGGAPGHERMGAVDAARWDALFAVNTRSAYLACRAAAALLGRAGGNIVLVGSVDGVKPVPAPVHYATSKAALSGMARAMAKELGPEGIRVNVVAPGVLEAGLSRTLPADLVAEYKKHCGLRRLGRLEEAAALVAWLALENRYVTAQTILLDGCL